ncbi:hypothetical protein ARMGADRAFT_1170873, partial [Armillaria gallica]
MFPLAFTASSNRYHAFTTIPIRSNAPIRLRSSTWFEVLRDSLSSNMLTTLRCSIVCVMDWIIDISISSLPSAPTYQRITLGKRSHDSISESVFRYVQRRTSFNCDIGQHSSTTFNLFQLQTTSPTESPSVPEPLVLPSIFILRSPAASSFCPRSTTGYSEAVQEASEAVQVHVIQERSTVRSNDGAHWCARGGILQRKACISMEVKLELADKAVHHHKVTLVLFAKPTFCLN